MAPAEVLFYSQPDGEWRTVGVVTPDFPESISNTGQDGLRYIFECSDNEGSTTILKDENGQISQVAQVGKGNTVELAFPSDKEPSKLIRVTHK